MHDCTTCKEHCKPLGNNVNGTVIQQYDKTSGWTVISKIFDKACEAKDKLVTFPDDGIDRRIYAAFND